MSEYSIGCSYSYTAGGTGAGNTVSVLRQLERKHLMELVRWHRVEEFFHNAPVEMSRVACQVEEEQRQIATEKQQQHITSIKPITQWPSQELWKEEE